MFHPRLAAKRNDGDVSALRHLVADEVLGRFAHPLPYVRHGGRCFDEEDVLRQRFAHDVEGGGERALERAFVAQRAEVSVLENDLEL